MAVKSICLLTLLCLFTCDAYIRGLDSCGNNQIALTIDDGVEIASEATDILLDVLNRAGIKATFFLDFAPSQNDIDQLLNTGKYTRESLREDQCSRVHKYLDNGHMLACHTMDHFDLTTSGKSNQELLTEQLEACRDWVDRCVKRDCKYPNGYRVTYFRPPYGYILQNQAEYFSQNDWIISLWSSNFDGDWISPNKWEFAQGIDRVFENYKRTFGDYPSSSVILVHDYAMFGMYDENGKHFFEHLREMWGGKYEFVTIDRCYESCPRERLINGFCKEPNTVHYGMASWTL